MCLFFLKIRDLKLSGFSAAEIKFLTTLQSVVYALKVMINVYKWHQGQVRTLSTNLRKTIDRIDGSRHNYGQHAHLYICCMKWNINNLRH
jgi:hypothetical protein